MTEKDELVEAGCKALKPNLFAYGLNGREGDGKMTRAHMAEIERDVRKTIASIRPTIERELLLEMLKEGWAYWEHWEGEDEQPEKHIRAFAKSHGLDLTQDGETK